MSRDGHVNNHSYVVFGFVCRQKAQEDQQWNAGLCSAAQHWDMLALNHHGD